jgi:hypothetical protein
MNTVLGAWISLAAILAAVTSYWLYTLAGITALRPLLGWPRRLFLGAGIVGTSAATLRSPEALSLIPLSLGTVLVFYAVTRQWVRCPAASELETLDPESVPAHELLALIPDGRAVPLAVLAQQRTVRIGNLLVVHCPLSRSIACFEAPTTPVRAELPHASGFSLRSGKRRWDGVDGTALDGGDNLNRRRVDVCSKAKWREQFPSGELFVADAAAPLPVFTERLPLLPAARGLSDPMRWGKADSTRWEAVPEGAVDSRRLSLAGGSQEAPFLLSRWAAHVRGLTTPKEAV